MAKKSLLVGPCLLALAVLGWLLADAPRVEKPGLSAKKPEAVRMAASGPGPDAALRPVSEVFPGADSRAGNWRTHHPATVVVAPYADLPMTFEQVAVKEDGRHLTWIGRNPAMPGASFVGIATPEGYDAVLLVPGSSQFNFHVRNGRVRVDEVVASGKDCEVGTVAGIIAGAPEASKGQYTAPVVEKTAAIGAPLNVDVLFLYNTRARAVAAERSSDPIGYIDGYARAALETANQVLQNSHVDTFVWRYVGLVSVPEYPEKVTVTEDLLMIAPDGPYADLVRNAKAQYGADQVLMWTGPGVRQGSAYGGLERNQPVERGGTVAALRLTAGILILAHELAHNFGCHHDRGHAGSGDGSVAQPEGDGFWCYGLLWVPPGGGTFTQGTVMSYADFLVPYFSNPGIVLGNQVLGYAESDPRAANNARILNDNSAYISTESVETEAMPVILQQPQDNVIVSGQAANLSVSAVGGGLSYQWARNGTPLAGANSSSLSRIITDAETGGYTVKVSNSRGTVDSRVASVSLITVAPAPATPPPVFAPSTGGGGGGGGGAPSAWFYAALLVLYGLKRRRD